MRHGVAMRSCVMEQVGKKFLAFEGDYSKSGALHISQNVTSLGGLVTYSINAAIKRSLDESRKTTNPWFLLLCHYITLRIIWSSAGFPSIQSQSYQPGDYLLKR